jgi:Flp pilus assembly protein TadD
MARTNTTTASAIRWIPAAVALFLSACASQPAGPNLPLLTQRALAEAAASGQNVSPDALANLRQAAQDAPDDATAQERYGLAAEKAHMYSEALAALDRANRTGGVTESRLNDQGRIALEAGNVPAAVRIYTAALKQNPNNVNALSGLGVAEDLQHHHVAAQTHYHEALGQAPGDWGVRSNLALSLLMSDKPSDAVAALAGAANDPTAPRRARHDLALALVAAGRRDQALAILRQDMPEAEASDLISQFVAFARWLASPDGTRPAVR